MRFMLYITHVRNDFKAKGKNKFQCKCYIQSLCSCTVHTQTIDKQSVKQNRNDYHTLFQQLLCPSFMWGQSMTSMTFFEHYQTICFFAFLFLFSLLHTFHLILTSNFTNIILNNKILNFNPFLVDLRPLVFFVQFLDLLLAILQFLFIFNQVSQFISTMFTSRLWCSEFRNVVIQMLYK